MLDSLWQTCLTQLEHELTEQELNIWIRPLQAIESAETLRLLAPNQHVREFVERTHLNRIQQISSALSGRKDLAVSVDIGSSERKAAEVVAPPRPIVREPASPPPVHVSALNPEYVFENFVEGKSNQLARAAGQQVAQNPGTDYNPLYIYGGTGLGKTHLMHATGNLLCGLNPKARVAYLHADRFIGDMIKALQHGTIDNFKRYYRSLDALLIDDIQFFAGKERSQEEFFHTFNALLEGRQQVVLSCDRYPKEVEGLEDRLKSRFGWGLTVAVDPPDLETRVAILMSKAQQLFQLNLSEDVAFFIAKRIESNVRDLEGALRRVVANAKLTGQPITVDLVKQALQDLLSLHEKLVTLDNIQRTVADYYKIRVADLLSSRRSRSITRPRQIAMTLAKELTGHSLPEIGAAFGGRDHTTVLHAIRKIRDMVQNDERTRDEYNNLLRTLRT